MADRVQQVGLAQAGLAVDDQRVVRLARCLGDGDGGGVGEPVGRADDEVLEQVARVQPRLGDRADAMAAAVGALGPAGDELVAGVVVLVVELGLGSGSDGLTTYVFVDISSCRRCIFSIRLGSIVTTRRVSCCSVVLIACSSAGRTRDSSWARVRSSWTATIRMLSCRRQRLGRVDPDLGSGRQGVDGCCQTVRDVRLDRRPGRRSSNASRHVPASVCPQGFPHGVNPNWRVGDMRLWKSRYRGDASSVVDAHTSGFPSVEDALGVSSGRGPRRWRMRGQFDLV